MKVITIRITLFLAIILMPLNILAQQRPVVTGNVKDTFGPLIEATVYFQNKDERALNGTTTDLNGDFFLRVPEGEPPASIVFSYIGYRTRTIPYTGQTEFNIDLIEDSQMLEEATITAQVINTDGMGIDTKATGGARQKVDLEELQDMPATSIADMLQGRMANVDIVAVSGAPGARSPIRIRGTASLNASNEPLIVIDEIPREVTIASDFDFGTATEEDFGALVNIAPSDIESIEVLKDASATAIYGSRAANGVLLIKTKRGSRSKPTFNINQKLSTSVEPARMPLLNGKEYVTLMQDAIWNRVRDDGYNNLGLIKQYKDILYDPSYNYFNEFNQDVDWMDYLTQSPLNSETNFSMSGGGEKAAYRFSTGYTTETGTTIGEDFQRVSARLNLDYNFSTKLRVSTQFSYVEGVRNASTGGPRGIASRKMPNMSPFVLDSEGNMTEEYFVAPRNSIQGSLYHPIALVTEAENRYLNREMGMNFNLNYKFNNQLQFTAIASFDLSTATRSEFLPASATSSPWDQAGEYNRGSASRNNGSGIFLDGRLNYLKTFATHHFVSAAARFQMNDRSNGNYGSSTGGNPSYELSSPNANGIVQSISSGTSDYRSAAVVGSFLYTYRNRYNFSAALRTDGNSSTGRNSRWGTFPSLSGTWYVHRESFLRDVDWVAELIPRFSWGTSGMSPSGSSTYAGTFEALDGAYNDLTGIKPNSMQLDKLKWETTTQYNAGINIGLLHDHRIHFSFDYYIKTTKDLLQRNMRIQSSTGYTTVPWFNDGSIENRGWEIYVRGRDIVKLGEVKIGVDFNISRNRNTVLELPKSSQDQSFTVGNGKYTNKLVENRPVGSFFGLRYLGVYQNSDETIARDRHGNVIKNINGENIITTINGTHQQRPGDAKYYDMNFDGIIDQYDVAYLGNAMPLMIGGGALNLFYKGFNVRGSFAYRLGQSVVNMARLNAEQMSGSDNQSTSVLRRWRYEGDDTEIPRALWGTGYNSLGSDRYVEKASFLKVKDITLSYRFDRKGIIEKFGLNGLYVYVTSFDPFTITNYTGQDPEVGIPGTFNTLAADNSLSPRPRRFALGINIDF